jgi:hypothetical protein
MNVHGMFMAMDYIMFNFFFLSLEGRWVIYYYLLFSNAWYVIVKVVIFHTDTILWTFGFNRYSAISDNPSPQLVC